MWKYMALLFVLFYACGNSTSSTETTAATTSAPKSENISKPKSFENNAEKGVQAPEETAKDNGAPAKFSIRFKENVSGLTYLIGTYADQNVRMDSSQIVSNTASFDKAEGYPQGLYYVIFPDNKFVQIMLAEDQTFSMETSLADPSQTTVKGSVENELFYENMKYERSHRAKMQPYTEVLKTAEKDSDSYNEAMKNRKALVSEREAHLAEIAKKHPNSFFVKFKEAGQNPTLREDLPNDEQVAAYRNEFWDNVDFSDIRIMRTPVIKNKLNRYFTEITPQNPDALKEAADNLLNRVLDYPRYYQFFANWIVFKYEPTKTTLMDAEAVFVHMIQNYFTYNRAFWSDSTQVYGLQLRAHEMAQSLIGQQGPNVTANDQYGKPQTLYDKTADYLVVYMFNPTCEHCAVETPKLIDLYNKEKGKGHLDVYSIVVDTDDKEWKDYLKKNNIEFTSVFDPTNKAIYAKYFVNVTPEVYVLNKDRIIIGKNLKIDQIEEVIRRDQNK